MKKWAFLVCLIGAVDPGVAQRRTLSLSAIQQLIEIKAPDNAIAEEILERGLDFPNNADIVSDLARRGAGTRTLDVLRSLVPLTSLRLDVGLPGCEVLVDGSSIGTTSVQGGLIIHKLPVGTHPIAIRCTGYAESAITARLALPETAIRVSPRQLVGTLTLTANVADATFTVPGYGTFHNALHELQLPVGIYEVLAIAPMHKPIELRLLIEDAISTKDIVHFEPDIRSFLRSMYSALYDGEYSLAVERANLLLARIPDNGLAQLALARSHLAQGRPTEFLESSRNAIVAGTRISLDVIHVVNDRSQHLDSMTIGTSTIEFTSTGPNCDLPTRIASKGVTGTKPGKSDTKLGPTIELTFAGHPKRARLALPSLANRQMPGQLIVEAVRKIIDESRDGHLRASLPTQSPNNAPDYRLESDSRSTSGTLSRWRIIVPNDGVFHKLEVTFSGYALFTFTPIEPNTASYTARLGRTDFNFHGIGTFEVGNGTSQERSMLFKLDENPLGPDQVEFDVQVDTRSK